MTTNAVLPAPPQPFMASWPKGTEPTCFKESIKNIWNLVSVIIFPIGLTRLAYYSLQSLAGRIIHPATWDTPPDLTLCREWLKQISGEELTIGTPDGEKINGMLFRGKQPSKKAIVATFGNFAFYEMAGLPFLAFVRAHVGEDVDLLVFNPRGCGKSTGSTSPSGLSLDSYSAAEYLVHEEKISPQDILFYGHSLGGYVGVSGAALFQKQYPTARIGALSDRSFCSLTEAAGQIAGKPAAWLVSLLGWELDPKEAWRELRGHKIIVYDKQDPVIPYPASFHHFIHSKNKCPTHAIEMQTPASAVEDAHNRPFNHDEAAEIGQSIRHALDL